MKKLNEILVNELLYELRNQYDYNMIDDCVQVTFYSNHKTDRCIIGKFYTMDAIGEWLLERYTVKAFTISIMESKTLGNKSIDIDIVLNI